MNELTHQDEQLYLIFHINRFLYALDVALVHEVILLPQLSTFAGVSPAIAGFLNFHREIIPVFDVSFCLGYPETIYHLKDYVVIVKSEDQLLGLILTDIVGIKNIDLETPKDPSQNLSEKGVFSIHLMGLHEDNIVSILDIHSLKRLVPQNLPTNLEKKEIREFKTEEHRSFFAERAHQLSKPIAKKRKQELFPLIIIQKGHEYFGLDPEFLKEVCFLNNFMPNPMPPPYILGFMNLRGMILPLIDIWTIIGMQPNEIKSLSKVLVIKVDDFVVGIVTDDILDLFSFSADEFKENPLDVIGLPHQFVKNAIHYKNNVLGVLDIRQVMKSISLSNEQQSSLGKQNPDNAG